MAAVTRSQIATFRLTSNIELCFKFMFILLYLFDHTLIFFFLRTSFSKFIALRGSSMSLAWSSMAILCLNFFSIMRHVSLRPSTSLVIDFVGQSWQNKTIVLAFVDGGIMAMQLLWVVILFRSYHPAFQPETSPGDVAASPLDQERVEALLAQLADTLRQHPGSHLSASPTMVAAMALRPGSERSPTLPQRPVSEMVPASSSSPSSSLGSAAANPEQANLLSPSSHAVQTQDDDHLEAEAPTTDGLLFDLTWATITDTYRISREIFNPTSADDNIQLPV
ncbi:hypothetical protein BJ085DRAFT_32248 [Dimargaris cristalligena]|uniref:DUF1746 domain-containing protein n=1 Tax=Dimargaris cristalligena TaxID=215637 RepID=A0A4Q0A0U1_9FUNG|nr:hypothetical protein BJ085DRAFT_32248 [Dimargaris cristalligena]|eukprot:RKP39348.1 hypothetical protein BJ085DRAFT_32248 [Dimargaris cristalligena]